MSQPDFKRRPFKPVRTDPCFCGSGQRFKSCCGTLAQSRKPPHGIHIVPGFLSPENCSRWVHYFESQTRKPLGVHDLDTTTPAGLAKIRISGRVTDEVSQGELAGPVIASVSDAYQHVIPSVMARNFAWFENPQVLRYEPGGLYGPHSDSDHFMPAESMWQKVIDRDVSLLLYLNQDFLGGELQFQQFNFTYRPRAGDLLFFPSHGHYAHQALPVKTGLRYVIVSWAAYRDEPRVLTMRPSDCIDISEDRV